MPYRPPPPIKTRQNHVDFLAATEAQEQEYRQQLGALGPPNSAVDVDELEWQAAIKELYHRYERKRLQLELDWLSEMREMVNRRMTQRHANN
jgi:hypothetical protein